MRSETIPCSLSQPVATSAELEVEVGGPVDAVEYELVDAASVRPTVIGDEQVFYCSSQWGR